jgi:hypothetical protein
VREDPWGQPMSCIVEAIQQDFVRLDPPAGRVDPS